MVKDIRYSEFNTNKILEEFIWLPKKMAMRMIGGGEQVQYKTYSTDAIKRRVDCRSEERVPL